MNVYVPSSIPATSSPRRIRERRHAARQLRLWIGSVLSAALAIVAAVLLAASAMTHEAVALDPVPPEPDPFLQQKHDARASDLPAQF